MKFTKDEMESILDLSSFDVENSMFKDIIKGLEEAYSIEIDVNKLISQKSDIQNSKSDFAKYVEKYGKVPNEYIRIKGKADERYRAIERLSQNI